MKKNRRILSLCIAMCMIFSLLAVAPVSVSADDSEPEYLYYGDFTYYIEDNCAKIYYYDGTDTYLYIPSEINGYPVTYLDEYFIGYTDVEYVYIPEGVTTIDDYAFSDCSYLTEIDIPSTVTSIGYNAFENCTYLESIYVSSSNKHYTSKNGVLFSKDMTELIKYPEYNTMTENYTIPTSVTYIHDCAFENVYYLDYVTIPIGVWYIGDYAFSGCEWLREITIPKNVTHIGTSAFSWCPLLSEINVNSTNKNYCSIDGILFSKDKSTLIAFPAGSYTYSYTIPNTTKTINTCAFEGCEDLSSVTIPNSVTEIQDYAFWYCTNLNSVSIGTGVSTIGERAFYHCENLQSVRIPNKVTEIKDGTFECCYALESATLPQNLTYIGTSAFDTCTNLESIAIPDTVTYIDDYAFYYCEILSSVTLGTQVEHIGRYAFYNCWELTDIDIPDKVEKIDDGAFSGCQSLSSVSMSEGVKYIGDYAFINCYDLESITIPNSVTNIGVYALGFYDYWDDYDYESYYYQLPGFEIYSYKGSEAEAYAKANSITNISLGDAPSTLILGDANLDGVITIKDATAIQKYLADLITFNSDNLKCSNVNGDNVTNIKDSTMIQKFLADLVEGFN